MRGSILFIPLKWFHFGFPFLKKFHLGLNFADSMLFPNKKKKVIPYSKPGMGVYTKIIVPDITEVLLQCLLEYFK